MIALVLAAALTADPQPPRVQWVVYTADWCQPCQRAKKDFTRWLVKSGWRVSADENAHVRMVNIDVGSDWPHEIEVVPTFLLIADGVVVEKWISYPGKHYLAKRYMEEHGKLK